MEKKVRPERRRMRPGLRHPAVIPLIAAALFIRASSSERVFSSSGASAIPAQGSETGLLKLLGIEASPESIDYVRDKTQFQLHTLLTEQRHPKTWNLSERIHKDTGVGLNMLLSVDDDVTERLRTLAGDTAAAEQAAAAAAEAMRSGKKIYIYGCGATGRLAKQMESSFWRPFWAKIADKYRKRRKAPPLPDDIQNRLIGEMTGADRALISSLEGFEDLPLIGRLQLADRGVVKGDVVICVTEGGETSSVIGTILAALDQWKSDPDYDPSQSRRFLYFVYNNPDDTLLPFERSRRVIEEPGITKINLATGPQAITGSTRMQATTIETYVVGGILQAAAYKILAEKLSPKELSRIGFDRSVRLDEHFRGFGRILDGVKAAVPALVPLTEAETETYRAGRFSTTFAERGLLTVFIDSTERSPTFRLHPLDTVKEPQRKCWIQVWTSAPDLRAAWRQFLGRPFRGLDPEFYGPPFAEKIGDPYLRRTALESLKKAGRDQEDLYDFSFSDFNLRNRGPERGDIGIIVLLDGEEKALRRNDSYERRFLDLFNRKGARTALVLVTGLAEKKYAKIVRDLSGKGLVSIRPVPVGIDASNDPFGLKQHIAAKILLNAHSTAVMAKLGKVVGNTMTNVSPSNLKLIGRATYLIQSHVNDVLSRAESARFFGRRLQVSYGEANAVLFDSISFLRDKKLEPGQPAAEVAFSIIRILESLKQKRGLDREEAYAIVRKTDLGGYLAGFFAESGMVPNAARPS